MSQNISKMVTQLVQIANNAAQLAKMHAEDNNLELSVHININVPSTPEYDDSGDWALWEDDDSDTWESRRNY